MTTPARRLRSNLVSGLRGSRRPVSLASASLLSLALPALSAHAAGISLGTPLRVSQTKGGPHTWPDSSKEVVGTSYGRDSSRVWFTTNRGILSEVYYPRIDRAQVSDLQLLFSNLGSGQPSFLEEKRDFSLSYENTGANPRARVRGSFSRNGVTIRFTKEVVVDPASPVLRVRYAFDQLPAGTKVHVLHKPAADGDGGNDVGRVAQSDIGPVLVAWDTEGRTQTYQLVATTGQVESSSVGSVGVDDGWQQLNRFGKIVYESDSVGPTNIALTSTVTVKDSLEIQVGFGASLDEAYGAVVASRGRSFDSVRSAFDGGWKGYFDSLSKASPWIATLPEDMRRDTFWNAAVVKAHEDKLNPGAIIASLGVPDLPRGTGAGDGKDVGGYHLVWPRDLYKSAKGMLRLGDLDTATAALKFMARQEMPDGRIAQNTWVDAKPFWVAQQMDQEAFPLILAGQLRERGVKLDAQTEAFLERRLAIVENSNGYSVQERWEEEGGFSPNTLAIMAAAMNYSGKKDKAARFLRIALEKSVTRNGPLSSKPYFMRIAQRGLPDAGDWLSINNGGPWLPESKVIDGGFLDWLRWFPDPQETFDALGEELLETIDSSLEVYNNPDNGVAFAVRGLPLFRRYNGDAYGLYGKGGPWPILTSESFLPRMARDNTVGFEAFRTVRSLWTPSRMCPEQLVVENETVRAMPFAASPLVWCHADMIELAYQATKR